MELTRRRPISVISLVLAVSAVVAWSCSSQAINQTGPGHHNGCLLNDTTDPSNASFAVCATSDMAKVTRQGAVPLEHPNYNLSAQALTLDAARNETVAFQLIVQRIQAAKNTASAAVKVTPSSWQLNGNQAIDEQSPVTEYFAAHYHYVDNAGYQWGPTSAVLNWPDYYPDALVPNAGRCSASTTTIFESIALPNERRGNQSIWFDVYVPKTASPGIHTQTVSLAIDGKTLDVPIQLNVYDTTLPDETSIHAVGEIFRAYNLEGIDGYIQNPKWQQMSQCYQQIAHQHRTVFIERVESSPGDAYWQPYLKTIEPMLNGELFSRESGYIGPGQNTPVGIWRTPWEQEINGRQEERIDTAFLAQVESDARSWQSFVTSIGATELDYFAYIFDEVDGPDRGADPAERAQYLANVHDDMASVQKAIDAGASSTPAIDLIWTSHSNPSQWANDPALDLTGKVRLWAPNASAADVEFLKTRQQAGDKIWFYHSGHPAIGVHSINASGIEMRTWGMAAARYGFDGQLMWAVNLGSDEEPFAHPSYKPDEDRFGNGVMVYPGNQLPKIGYPATPGPLPSMRLKAWRRGLQDAELVALVREQGDAETITAMEARLKALIPVAFTEGQGSAAWSNAPSDWIDFRRSLLSP